MNNENMGDVWKLETPAEEIGSEEVNYLYELATKGKVSARNILKKAFEDNWDTIKERFETEGSAWYVWYMDGVRNYLVNYRI